jgi:hypothetical protein
MHVPKRHLAEVPPQKITAYLLDDTHPEGGDKARFFLSHGFSPLRPQELSNALLGHVRELEIANTRTNPYGTTYAVDGPIAAPNGRKPFIRSVWVRESTRPNPRLVSAYPVGKMTA